MIHKKRLKAACKFLVTYFEHPYSIWLWVKVKSLANTIRYLTLIKRLQSTIICTNFQTCTNQQLIIYIQLYVLILDIRI